MLQTINLESHLEEISNQGWTVLPIDSKLCHALANQANLRLKQNNFKDAALSQSEKPLSHIRNDRILWLDAKKIDLSEVEINILNDLENLKICLTNYFRIHLSEVECHYAVYDSGHFYHRHVDTTTVNNKRFFSFVIYLNENWTEIDGGALTGYQNEQILFQVQPKAGSMILFRSDIEHEVLVANRQRWSLTGWFRK